jgi:hypothetical protein
VIPAGVTKFGEYAFRGCSRLTNLVIPAGVTEIGEGAFSGCSSLTSLVVPSALDISRASVPSGVDIVIV